VRPVSASGPQVPEWSIQGSTNRVQLATLVYPVLVWVSVHQVLALSTQELTSRVLQVM